MNRFPKVCDGCGDDISSTGKASTMSRFNTDIICMDCKEKERKHPTRALWCTAGSS